MDLAFLRAFFFFSRSTSNSRSSACKRTVASACWKAFCSNIKGIFGMPIPVPTPKSCPILPEGVQSGRNICRPAVDAPAGAGSPESGTRRVEVAGTSCGFCKSCWGNKVSNDLLIYSIPCRSFTGYPAEEVPPFAKSQGRKWCQACRRTPSRHA